jgi:hypothetical protein
MALRVCDKFGGGLALGRLKRLRKKANAGLGSAGFSLGSSPPVKAPAAWPWLQSIRGGRGDTSQQKRHDDINIVHTPAPVKPLSMPVLCISLPRHLSHSNDSDHETQQKFTSPTNLSRTLAPIHT